jgi:hypothetical protein
MNQKNSSLRERSDNCAPWASHWCGLRKLSFENNMQISDDMHTSLIVNDILRDFLKKGNS